MQKMKKVVIIILFPFMLYAQEATQDQSIELPEFVITGEQNISIPVMKKDRPEFVPTLSDEFFRPVYSPKQLTLSKRSDPIERELNLYKGSKAYSGLLILGAGYRTLPQGKLYYNHNSDNFLFKSKLYGSNTTEYIKNSGYNVSGVTASLDFYVNNQSSFLPGLNINLAGDFLRDSYKFYGSDNPADERETFNTYGILSFQSDVSQNVNYAVSGETELLDLKDISFKEYLYSGKLDLDISFDNFGIGANGVYKYQDIDSNSVKSDNYYYGGNLYAVLEPSNSFKFKFGVHYSTVDTAEYIAPFGIISFELDNNWTLVGKYTPNTEFTTYNKFIEKNKFIGINSNEYIFQKNDYNASVIIKYQYMKYYEINLGASYAKVDDLPYFDDDGTKGVFYLKKVRDIDRFQAYINLLFHSGPYGFFYGEIKYNRVQLADGKNVPYYPELSTGLIYGLEISNSLSAKTKLDIFMENYAGVENRVTLPAYIDWSMYLNYNLSGNLKLTLAVENILNNSNYIYNGYQEKTIDFIGGIQYRW
jgi:hypothetical protein